MDIVSAEQLLTVVLFLALLGVGAWVARMRGRQGGPLAAGRRMRVAETMALAPGERALILTVDGRDYLLLRARGAAPVLHPLPGVEMPA